VVDVELAGLDGAGACRGRQADATSAHADPFRKRYGLTIAHRPGAFRP